MQMDDVLPGVVDRQPEPQCIKLPAFLGLSGRKRSFSPNIAEGLMLFQFMNVIWVVIPLWLMYDSYSHIASSLRLVQSTKSKVA